MKRMKKLVMVTFLISIPLLSIAQWNTGSNGIQYSSGNVGVGVNATSGIKLRIVSSGTDDGQFRFQSIAGDEAFFSMNNGQNWGVMMRSNSNFPIIGAYTGGQLRIHPYSSSSGTLDGNKGVLTAFDFANMRVGIGTTNPDANLEIYGVGGLPDSPNVALILDFESNSTTIDGGGTAILFRGKSSGGNIAKYDQARIRSVGYDSNNSHGLAFDYKPNASTYLSEGMRLTKNGRLGIGVSSPKEMLEVNGTMRAKRVKVEANGWPDYVFAPSFQLRSLSEVESYIKENQHLPEVPSSEEVEMDGLDLGAMDATLLKKVEELTLYTIDQEKRIKKQDQLISDLMKRLEKLEKKD